MRHLNMQWPNERSYKMFKLMGLSPRMINAFNQQSLEGTRTLEHLVRCVPLSWIVFDTNTEYLARADFCRAQGWVMTNERVCEKPGAHVPLQRKPEECL
ncbi:MAG: hypothetical protein HC883_01270 [Bdellovibrionaceae bacterium]|nr:hypothetical protein [Pseudobdellovibrionaceae bacterium]